MARPLRKRKQISPVLFITFGAVIMLACAFIGYKMLSKKNCEDLKGEINISSDNGQYLAGEPIRFTYSGDQLDSIRWDFGDNTPGNMSTDVYHTFQLPGAYEVKAICNGECVLKKPIEVLLNKEFVPEETMEISIRQSADIIRVGETVTFECIAANDTSWIWSFTDDKSATSKERKQLATYKFRDVCEGGGVSVFVNGKHPQSIKVNVLPEQTKALKTGAKPIEFTASDFVKMFKQNQGGGDNTIKITAKNSRLLCEKAVVIIDGQKPKLNTFLDKHQMSSDINIEKYNIKVERNAECGAYQFTLTKK
ncbi:MAG: PKD domain-containing protein [Flavobacteriales bacterium]|nr:PKD domain-containing protein [Flavobacteriales bacterium]